MIVMVLGTGNFERMTMVPFMVGLLIVAGVVGGIENLPPDPSASTIGMLLAFTILGFMMMFAGVKSIKEKM